METIISKRISRKVLLNYFNHGLDYKNYSRQFENEIIAIKGGVTASEANYLLLNFQRAKRIDKLFQIGYDLKIEVSKVYQPVNWIVISEFWCGDAAQNLGILEKAASFSAGKIQLRIVKRDQHEELMNSFLTNGSKSIPKLIQFDNHGNISGIWGPRPKEAQNLVKDLKNNPETVANYGIELHKWYANDKGLSLQHELINLLRN
ncbi:thioredoxin family protein [soil metagenome]